MSLFVVKNDKGEWLYSDEYNDWVDQLSQATFYDTFEDADDDIECWELSNAYVVELVEASAKVAVSEEEDKVLKKAKNTTVWRPASVIERYAREHERQADDEVLLEDRLMRAYVIGWEVEKPKLWNVKVKHAQDSYYYKTHVLGKPIVRAFQIAGGNKFDDRAAFTLAEIENYSLQDCDKEEVTDDEQ